jgi:hypothetical protein
MREDRDVKTTIIALSVAALAATPAVPAQGASGRAPALQHQVSKKHHVAAHARPHDMQATGAARGFPGAFGYAPFEPKSYLDRDLEVSGRQAGGMGSGM